MGDGAGGRPRQARRSPHVTGLRGGRRALFERRPRHLRLRCRRAGRARSVGLVAQMPDRRARIGGLRRSPDRRRLARGHKGRRVVRARATWTTTTTCRSTSRKWPTGWTTMRNGIRCAFEHAYHGLEIMSGMYRSVIEGGQIALPLTSGMDEIAASEGARAEPAGLDDAGRQRQGIREERMKEEGRRRKEEGGRATLPYDHSHDFRQTRRLWRQPALCRVHGRLRARRGYWFAGVVRQGSGAGDVRGVAVWRMLFQVVTRDDHDAPSERLILARFTSREESRRVTSAAGSERSHQRSDRGLPRTWVWTSWTMRVVRR